MSTDPFRLVEKVAIRYVDNRGYLDVLYEQREVVLKRSFSAAGVFRGMHWQRPPHSQTKLIRVASGRILDFVVSPCATLPTVYYRELTPSDGWVQIDASLAHGFYALEDTEFEYLCHGAYNEAAEASFSIEAFLRSELGLSLITMSAKDRGATPLSVVDGGKFG